MAELLFSCQRRQGKPHPQWSLDCAIYELNVRQFTKEGTFLAASKHLKRLSDMNVGILWIMPIFPIGIERRKGSLGSYYSIADFRDVNSEFGNISDFINFVQEAHRHGIRVIMDWVTNHTARDAKWTVEHPDWYVWNGAEIATPFDWSDTAKLNYDNFEMRREMVESMKFWLQIAGVDGFRMDMAMLVPSDFWEFAITELRSTREDIFMLAEAEGEIFHKVGFDATYGWEVHHLFNDIAQGRANAWDLCGMLKKESIEYSSDSIKMMFTSNHDENSWNGSEFERMGDGAYTFAALTYVLNGMPLIYSGQEVSLCRRLEFFDKDEIDWSGLESDHLYDRLGQIKKHEALRSGKDGGDVIRMDCDNGDKVFALKRKCGERVVVALFNLSGQATMTKIYDDDFNGAYRQIGSSEEAYLKAGSDFYLDKWGWFIYFK